MRVFISCVSDEFRSYRNALRQVLTARNIEIHVQEDFTDGGGTLLAKLDDYLRCCDALIHLVGDGTGNLAKPAEVRDLLRRHPDLPTALRELAPWLDPDTCPFSYTQWEAFLALYHRRDCYVFRATPESARERGWQATRESIAAQQAHIDRLRSLGKDRSTCDFKDARDIAIRFLKSFRGEDFDPVAPLEPEPPTAAEWAAFIAWQQTRVAGLDLGIGRDTVLIDLGVEVERTAGLRSSIRNLGKRRYRGRRVQQAIQSMLKDASRLPLLLEGEPGAGKSIALAQFAKASLASCGKRKPSARIPLFVSLSRLPTPPGGHRATAEHILHHIIRTAAGLEGAELGTGAPALHERCLRWGLKQGRFCILFDGFDEIPGLLAAEDSGQTAREYGLAVQAFTADPTFGHNQTVVASRPYRSPDALLWPKLTLKPLDDKRIREAVDRRFGPKSPRNGSKRLAEGVFQELAERWEMLGELLRNPLFLDLVCRYRADNDRPPESMAEAFEDFVRRRLTDDAERLACMGLTPEDIEHGAAEIAFRMTADRRLGLKPDPGVLLATLNNDGWSLPMLPERVVAVLKEVHLAAIERVDGAALFCFKPHRRFHEYFTTRAVLADPSRLPTADLLWGEKWRETTITLLETADLEDLRPIHAEIGRITSEWADSEGLPAMIDGLPVTALAPQQLREALLAAGTGDKNKAFEWPTRAPHLLDLLNNAGARGAHRDPITAENVDRLLIAAFTTAKRLDQKRAVESAHAASPEGTQWLLNAAFGSASAMLSDVALSQTQHLRKLPEGIRPRIRESLVARWAVGGFDKKTWDLTRRRLLHIDGTGELQRALTLLRAIRPIAIALLTVPLLWIYFATYSLSYAHVAEVTSEDFLIITFVYFIFILLPLLASISDVVLLSRKRATSCASLSPSRCVWQAFLAPRILPRVYFVAILALFIIAVIDSEGANKPDFDADILAREPGLTGAVLFPLVPSLMLWLMWDHAAPLAALTGRFLRPWQWLFVWLVPLVIFPRWLLEVSLAVVHLAKNSRLWLAIALYLLALPGIGLVLQEAKISDEPLPYDFGPATRPLAVLALLFLLPSVLSDARSRLLSFGKGPVPISKVLNRCAAGSIFGLHERLRLLRTLRRRKRLAASAKTKSQVADAISAISRDVDGARASPWIKPRPDPGWDPAVQRWYRKYARRGRGVAYLDGPVLDELVLLHAEIVSSIHYPARP
jgi:hypothetical protein